MAIFIYGTANNTGKNFFTLEDRRNFFLRGYTGHDGSNYVDAWVIGYNEKGATWLAEKDGTEKTKAELQEEILADAFDNSYRLLIKAISFDEMIEDKYRNDLDAVLAFDPELGPALSELENMIDFYIELS